MQDDLVCYVFRHREAKIVAKVEKVATYTILAHDREDVLSLPDFVDRYYVRMV